MSAFEDIWRWLLRQGRSAFWLVAQIVCYVFIIVIIALQIHVRGEPQFVAQRYLGINHLIGSDDVVMKNRLQLGPPLRAPDDFVGRYVVRAVQKNAVISYDDTVGDPSFSTSARVLWLAPAEVRFVDARRLDAGEYVDVCVPDKACPFINVKVAAGACSRGNPDECRVGLLVSASQLRLLVPIVDAVAASAAKKRIRLIRTYSAGGK